MDTLSFTYILLSVVGIGIILWLRTPSGKQWLGDDA